LLKREEFGKDIKIELGKRDKNIDIESENDNSEDDGGDNFRDFEDNTFLESEESEYESENYIEDETNDEKNSENKN